MTDHDRQQRLDLLVLARVAGTGSSARLTPSNVRDSVMRYAGADRSPAERRSEVSARIADLQERGLLTSSPLALTEEGRKWLCDGLGVTSVPSWKAACEKVAPTLALGMRPGSRDAEHAFATTEQVQLAIIARHFDLPLTRPTRASVLNALVAQALDTRRPVRSARDVRPLLTERWVEHDRWQPGAPDEAPTAAPPAPAETPAPGPLDPGDFAAAVRAAATQEQEGRFGDRKVFISALHRRLTGTDDRFAGMTPEAFKARLLDANARRLLTLARADYVAAMDPAEVAASHIHDATSDFHFVLDEVQR